jgi:hypothetical protein
MRVATHILLCSLLLAVPFGCTTTSTGTVSLRPDGSPGPEKCPEEALKAMKYLRLTVGDAALVELDVNQDDVSPITLYDGPIETMLEGDLGLLQSPTRLYGRVWTSGPQVVIRYYEAKPPDGDKVPICAVARSSKGQLRKQPGSKPGTAILEFSSSMAFIVDEFR